MRCVLAFGVCAMVAMMAPATAARADIVNVAVFDFDFSANGENDPIIDPVINVGDTVTWTWIKGTHSVTSVLGQAEQFDSGVGGLQGMQFSHTFTHPGTFWYYCVINGHDNGDGTASGMSGTVTVNPVPSPGALALLVAGSCILGVRQRRS